MAAQRLLKRFTSLGDPVALIAITLVAAVLFGGYLNFQNTRAEALFKRLKISDPPRYLDDLRRLEGFDDYISAFRTMEGFGAFRSQAPRFLIGRWTMRDEIVRLPPSGSFSQCDNPLLIENGLLTIRFADQPPLTRPAAYRLTANGILEVRTGEQDAGQDVGQDVLRIAIVAYGAQVDHLTLTPPGRDAPVHAYPCTA